MFYIQSVYKTNSWAGFLQHDDFEFIATSNLVDKFGARVFRY